MSQPGSGVYERQPMTIRATGENRRIAGIDCAMHMVSEGGQPVEEVCVATPQSVGIPQDDYQTLRGMFAFMQEMADQVMGGASGFAMPDFDGVPVQIRDLDDGSVSTLRSVSTRKINANALSVPADYRQLDPYQ